MSKRVASPGRHSSNKAARLSSSSSSSKATNSKLLELERENKELREKLTKYEANEIAKKAEEEANKPTYPCCRHIDSSHETKLQPDGSAYCDNCESANSCVHATGMDYQYLTWQCLDCQSGIGWGEAQWTMFCGDCLNERSNPSKNVECGECGNKQYLDPDEACDRYIYKPLSDDGCCAPCQARRDQEEAEEAAELAREEAEEAAELAREESTSSTSGSKPISITEE
tara:strand:- start:62 stop:742 length:681 start_codon:yes stop_codon:yes gene_type:complete